MDQRSPTANRVLPINRRQLLFAFILIGYGVIFGGVYSSIYFRVWFITHLLIIIGLSFGLLWPAIRFKIWPATTLDTPLLVLGLTMAISALLSPWLRLTLDSLFLWLSQVLFFYLIIKLMRNGWSDSLLRALMLVTGVIILISLFELAAWYFGVPFVPQFSQGWWEIGGLANPIPPTWYRLSFMLNNPVVLSAYLVLVIPLAIVFLPTTRGFGDQLLVALFVIAVLIAFTFTFSRGGWLGVGAGISTLAGLWLWRNYRRFSSKKRLFLTSLLGLVTLAAIGTIILIIWSSWESRSGSNAERIAYWQAAIYLFKQNPIWGIGPGLYRWGWRLSPFHLDINDGVVTAHNIFLHQLAELGTIGGLAGFWLLIIAGITFWRVVNNTKDSRLWWRRAGCLSGLVGFLVQGMFETLPDWPIALPMIILSAYLIAPSHQHWWPRQSQITSTSTGRQNRWLGRLPALNSSLKTSKRYTGPILWLMWLLCALFVTYFAYPRALAEKARRAAAGDHTEQAIVLAQQSNRLDPKFTLYQFETGKWLADLINYQAAKTIYQTALNVEPTYGLNHANLAAIEWQLGKNEAALNGMIKATQLAPSIPEFWLTLGLYAEETAHYEQAVSAYAQTILANPGWLNSNFWQMSRWRRENLDAIFRNALEELPPLQSSQLEFESYLQANDLTKAESTLNDIIQHSPDGYAYHLAAAKLNLAQNNLETAMAHCQKAGQLQKTDSQVYILQAKILLELGDLDQAEKVIKHALFLTQSSAPEAYYILGRIKEAQGLSPEAETAYWRGYKSQAFSLNYSAALYRQLGSVLPLSILQRTSGGSTAAQAWFALAKLYEMEGRFQEAINIYHLLLNQDPFLNQAQTELDRLCQKNQTLCREEITPQ